VAQVEYPSEIRALVAQLKRLPGIGPRGAERIAVWIMEQGKGFAEDFSDALLAAGERVQPCDVCGFYSTVEVGCPVCSDHRRAQDVICVVEQPTDVLPLERSGSFGGLYHVLGGRLSPLDGIGADDLRIAALVRRVGQGGVAEVILALSADVEGEATANYVAELLGRKGEGGTSVTVTRLAQGLPAGGGLEHADALTLARALSGRRAL
jgi:recombination protein RecR